MIDFCVELITIDNKQNHIAGLKICNFGSNSDDHLLVTFVKNAH